MGNFETGVYSKFGYILALRITPPEGNPPNTGFEHTIAHFSRAP